MRLFGEDDPANVPPGKIGVGMAIDDFTSLLRRVETQLDRLESREPARPTNSRAFTALFLILAILAGSISIACYLAAIWFHWYTARPPGL